jgi:AcrR family transcriptional regulator
MTQGITRPPGRPRAFDERVILRRVLDVFWDKGYDATSMSDLVKETGVNTPSLYATFGNKEQLYMRAVELYIELVGGITEEMLSKHDRLMDAIRALLEAHVRLYTQFDPPRGCMVVRSVGEASTVSPKTRARLHLYREQVGIAIRNRVQEAVDAGELPGDEDVLATADMYHNFLNGLTVQVADGIPAERLIAAIGRLCDAGSN